MVSLLIYKITDHPKVETNFFHTRKMYSLQPNKSKEVYTIQIDWTEHSIQRHIRKDDSAINEAAEVFERSGLLSTRIKENGRENFHGKILYGVYTRVLNDDQADQFKNLLKEQRIAYEATQRELRILTFVNEGCNF